MSEFDSVASTSDCDPIETIGAAGSLLVSALSQAMTRHEQTYGMLDIDRHAGHMDGNGTMVGARSGRNG